MLNLLNSEVQNLNENLIQSDDTKLFNTYFKKVMLVGAYAVLEVSIEKQSTQIVVEYDPDWLQKSLNKFFKVETKQLTFEQIDRFLKTFNKKQSFALRSDILTQNDVPSHEIKQLLYLDAELKSNRNQHFTIPILAQILFENYTQFDSRLAQYRDLETLTNTYKQFCILIRNPLSANQFFGYDPNSVQHNRIFEIQQLTTKKYSIDLSALLIKRPETVWNEKTKLITLIAENTKEIQFKVAGRTPAERRFKTEQNLINTAGPDDLVPLELHFLPYYRPLGHTVIRIGEYLYELSNKGWKIHGTGSDSARAFLFNNPFFKNQFMLLRKFGVPPISFGKTIYLKKSQTDIIHIILENYVSSKKRPENKFNILTNNCNQGILRVLDAAGVKGFAKNGYFAFSSVLSFNKFIVDFSNHHETDDTINVYPLPNQILTEAQLRKYIPTVIYRKSSIQSEFIRTLPRYFHNIVYSQFHHFKKKLNRFKNTVLSSEIQAQE